MDKIVITDKEKLTELFYGSLEYLGIIDKDVDNMVNAINDKIEAKAISDDRELNKFQSEYLADFILQRYQAVVVSSDEKVFGSNGNEEVLLFDGEDTNVFRDAQFL
jgi:hypothetical protein